MDEKARTPRERRQARTRQEILDAARKIITGQGIAAFSMRALARKTDYSPSGLYKYFGSKEEIIEAIRVEGFERLVQVVLQSIDEGRSPRQNLIEASHAYLRFADQYSEHYYLMFALTPQTITVERIVQYFDESGVSRLMEVGLELGDIKPLNGLDARDLLYQGWVTLHGIAMLRLSLLRNLQAEFEALDRRIVESWIASFTDE